MDSLLRLIEKKRDGLSHTEGELRTLANGAAQGAFPDEQLAAWLMAATIRGLNADETAWLTLAMAQSGERLDLAGLPKPWVDKHSTGGVGDKTTLVLLPLLAACGLTVLKMSGRGLGITGGTVDKLSAVPSFRLDLSPEAMKAQARSIGLAWTGQTPALAPADKKLYAIRDATGSVESIPLIVSSILSKKIAAGAEVVVLDVKCGSGAFMHDLAEAEKLRAVLEETGARCGVRVRALLTDMDQPLGAAVGNALEVREALELIEGRGPARVRKLCLLLAAYTLHESKLVESLEAGHRRAMEALDGGAARQKMAAWFSAQGADWDALPDSLPLAPIRESVRYEGPGGWVSRVDARAVGEAALDLGAGRRFQGQPLDLAAGIECRRIVGDRLEPGDTLFELHAGTREAAETARSRLLEAVGVSKTEVPPRPVLLSAEPLG